MHGRAGLRLLAPLLAAPFVVAALVGCEGFSCPSGQHTAITGYTQVWHPGTKVGGVTTPGYFSQSPNYSCVEDR